MKVIVDANIVFSAILNTDGRIGDLLLNSGGLVNFVSPRYMSSEVKKYFSKIQFLSGKSLEEIERIYFKIQKVITHISEEQVPQEIWIKADEILKDIDPKDTPYLAFAKFLEVKIWTGDKALKTGLSKKGFDCTITTAELYNYRNKLIKTGYRRKT
jgi:predicted nucleic acid-binding protein